MGKSRRGASPSEKEGPPPLAEKRDSFSVRVNGWVQIGRGKKNAVGSILLGQALPYRKKMRLEGGYKRKKRGIAYYKLFH